MIFNSFLYKIKYICIYIKYINNKIKYINIYIDINKLVYYIDIKK